MDLTSAPEIESEVNNQYRTTLIPSLHFLTIKRYSTPYTIFTVLFVLLVALMLASYNALLQLVTHMVILLTQTLNIKFLQTMKKQWVQ